MSAFHFTVTGPGFDAFDVGIDTSLPVVEITAPTGVDVTAVLQAQIDGCPDNRILQFIGGPHQIEGTLTVAGRNNLDVRGFDLFSTVAAPSGDSVTDRTRSHLKILGGSDIKLRNGRIVGPHSGGGTSTGAYVAALEAQHAVEVDGTQGVELDDLDLSYVYGDFVYIRGGASRVWCHGGEWHHNGRQGFSPTDCTDVLLEGFNIHDVRRAMCDIEPYAASQVVRRVTIRNGVCGDGRLNFFSCASSAQAVIEDVLFENVTLLPGVALARAMNSSIKAPAAARRRNFAFVNVTASDGYGSPQGFVVEFENIDGVHMHGCTQPVSASRSMYLASAVGCTDVNVSLDDNTVPNALGALKPNG